jgi:hypothetical protein
VGTLQDAVQLSIQGGFTIDSLFIFARALKAFEIIHSRRLQPADLQSAFSQWWNAAKALLPEDADFDEYRLIFEDTFAKTKSPLGSNSLEEAIRRADAGPLPPQAERYTSLKIKRLVAVCFQLQLIQGTSPFFISVRDAMKIARASGTTQASAWLNGLVRDGVLVEVEKGTRKRATRFRFNIPESTPGGDTNDAPAANPQLCDRLAPIDPPASGSKSTTANPSTAQKHTPYQLVHRKAALQDLIKGLGYEDSRDREEVKLRNCYQAELKRVNILLAGLTTVAASSACRDGH